jgi:hypothetical protein
LIVKAFVRASGNDEIAPKVAIPFKPDPEREQQRPMYRRLRLARKIDYGAACLS